MKVKVILDKWHLRTIEWAISDSLWICESNRRSICNFTRPWLYLPLPICINCRALAWEWVYVYKLAFFFWLSPRTYHFLFEKRLIIDWWYFWRNIALSLILWVSPDYLLKLQKEEFYHITVILQYCWDKTITQSGDIYKDDSGIISLDIKYFGITNTSIQNFPIRISSHKTVPKCLKKLKVLWTNFIYMFYLYWYLHSVL